RAGSFVGFIGSPSTSPERQRGELSTEYPVLSLRWRSGLVEQSDQSQELQILARLVETAAAERKHDAMPARADLPLVRADVLPANAGVVEPEQVGRGGFEDLTQDVLAEVVRRAQDGGDQDVQEAVRHHLQFRIRV